MSIKLTLFTLLIIALTASTFSTTIDIQGESLAENQLYTKKIKGAEMHTYEIKVPSNWSNSDLVIDSYLVSSQKQATSPLVFISLKPLSTDENDKEQWICNQLGDETCFLPAKYLQPSNSVYIGIFCENCEYNLKYSFKKETALKLGETNMFHLKAGDSKIFDLNISNTSDYKEYINISSFNLRQTQYEMKVQIVNNQDSTSTPITANVNSSWIGGQQSIIYPKNFLLSGEKENNLMNYSFKIIFTAHENGVFSLEASSGNTTIALTDSNIRFDSTSENAPSCYSYSASKNENININVKSIHGEVVIRTQENKKPAFDDYTNKFSVSEAREEKITIKTSDSINTLYLCVESERSAYYTINVYTDGKQESVKSYKKLLMSK